MIVPICSKQTAEFVNIYNILFYDIEIFEIVVILWLYKVIKGFKHFVSYYFNIIMTRVQIIIYE